MAYLMRRNRNVSFTAPTAKEVQQSERAAKKERKTTASGESEMSRKYPDKYQPLYTPARFLTSEYDSYSGEGTTKVYTEVAIKRHDNDNGLPYLFIQRYQEGPRYTGYTKGAVAIPLTKVETLMGTIQCFMDHAEKDGLLKEFED